MQMIFRKKATITAEQRWPNTVIYGSGRYAAPLRNSSRAVTGVVLYRTIAEAQRWNHSELIDLNR
jgi:hypothetical protein